MNVDLSQLKIPGPTTTALTAKFWDAVSEGQLIIQFCEECSEAVFYPRLFCPHCWSNRLVWRKASGCGVLKSFTEVHKPGNPGWLDAAPYVVGLVALQEGPTMLSLIIPEKGYSCLVGDLLKFVPMNIGGRILPVFKPLPKERKSLTEEN